MKDIFENLNRVFENRVRLAVMSILLVHERIDFNSLKETLRLTDGNLASHITVLEKNNYLKVTKKFVAKKSVTTYSATTGGKRAFSEHLNALEQLIKKTQ